MIQHHSLYKLVVGFVAICALSACGGGGGGGSSDGGNGGGNGGNNVQGLPMAKNMAVVSTQNQSSPAQSPNTMRAQSNSSPDANPADAPQTVPADSDYYTDETHTYVWDESMNSLRTVNMILCLMDQTRASDLVNQGAYLALVNEDKCEQGRNQSSAGTSGESSGGKSVRYNKWTIISTRADNTSPQYVKIWVPGEANSPNPNEAENILVEVTVNEGVSPQKPYGRFKLNFKGVVDAGDFGGPQGTEVLTMNGTLETVDHQQGLPQFRFINLGGSAANDQLPGNFAFTEAANVILDNADGDGGKALAAFSFSDDRGSEQGSFAINFNVANVLRGKDTDNNNTADEQQCLSRTDFNTQAWRYNLYRTTDGSRVELNSGFPFRYNSTHGHVGYWGLWVENGVSIPDGATIVKEDFQSGSSANYTVHIAPGKLIRRTANQVDLSRYEGDQFYTWAQHPTLGNPQANNFNSWVITVSSGEFVITHGVTWGENGPQLTDVADGTISFNFQGENLWLWSDALGGNVVYVHDPNVQPGNRRATYYAQEFVYAGDTTLFTGGGTSTTLYCYERCVKGGLTQTDVTNANGPNDLNYDPAGGPYAYTAQSTNGKLLLKDHLGKIVSADGLDMSSLGFDWGINTGEMVTSTSGIDNPWDVYNQAVSYRWETGSNSWSKLVTVRDGSGNVVVFDKPMAFAYTHSVANDANNSATHDGKTFLLQYGGPGELWGFPWEQRGERWYAAVTLKDGVQLTEGVSSYLVKAIEKEQTMKEDAAGCGTLNVDSLFMDPDLTLPGANDIGSVSITLAGKPVVTDPPRVIDGKLQ